MVAVVGVHGVLILVGVVLAYEHSGLETHLEAPAALAAQLLHEADAHAGTNAFANPAAVLVEADAEQSQMAVALKIEAAEGCALTRRVLPDVARTQVVACLHLVVAHLKVFVGPVVLPPRAVERCTVGEVAVLGIVLHSHVGQRTVAVVAGHPHAVEQQVGLHRQQLAALKPFLLARSTQSTRSIQSIQSTLTALTALFLRLLLVEYHHSRSSQHGEVVGLQPLPQQSEVLLHEHLLQLLGAALRQVDGAQLAHKLVVAVVALAHHVQQGLIVLGLALHIEAAVGHVRRQTRVHEVVEGLGTLLSQPHVELTRTLGRSRAAQHYAQQAQAVAVDAWQHLVLKLGKSLVAYGQARVAHGEHHGGGHVVELFGTQTRYLTAVGSNDVCVPFA